MKKYTEDTVPILPNTVENEILCLKYFIQKLEKNPKKYKDILNFARLQIKFFLTNMDDIEKNKNKNKQ